MSQLTGRDKSAHDGGGLSGNLHGDSVWLGNVRTPVSSSDGDDVELGVDDSTSDGGSDFLGTLETKSDVSRMSARRDKVTRDALVVERRSRAEAL